jgi:hypothetical protein
MSLSSLPPIPTLQWPAAFKSLKKSGPAIPPRVVTVLLSVAMVAGLATTCYWLWRALDAIQRPAPPPPRVPLDFKLVRQRFRQVRPMASREEVEELLGPPSFQTEYEPDFEDINARVWARPDRYPGEHSWAKWIDPQDKGKWVAVFFAGDRVYRTLHKGLPPQPDR